MPLMKIRWDADFSFHILSVLILKLLNNEEIWPGGSGVGGRESLTIHEF
jgi:hypothetical protein